jgi:hypothetical protein
MNSKKKVITEVVPKRKKVLFFKKLEILIFGECDRIFIIAFRVLNISFDCSDVIIRIRRNL